MMVSADNDPRRAGTIWTFSVDEWIPVITPLAPATFLRVESQSAPELAEAMGDDGLAEVLKRFEKGSRCYAAHIHGKLAVYGWVSYEDEFIGELNLRLRLLPGEAYIWNCVTLPAFRQNYQYSALLTYIVGELKKEPFSRVWIGADLDNVPSQRGIARAGFTHIADLVVARVLALRQVWVQGLPDVPESIVAEARRAFLNDRDKVWLQALTSTLSD